MYTDKDIYKISLLGISDKEKFHTWFNGKPVSDWNTTNYFPLIRLSRVIF